jgi:hypothetical protein
MNIEFGREGRSIAEGALRWVVVALVMTPVVAAIDLAARGSLEGWPGSRLDQLAGYALLTAPFLLIVGAPAAVLYLIVVRLIRPRRAGAVLLAVLVAGGCLTLLVALPRDLAFDEVTLRTGLASIPLWLVLGALVPRPSR